MNMEDRVPRALSALSDEDLVDLVNDARDLAAADELFGRYHARILAWCRRIVRDPERARDVAQDAQLKALRRLHRFERRAKFSTWLFVVVRNTCLTAVRPVSLVRDHEADLDAFVDPNPGADERLAATQDEATLRALLDTALEDDERRALSLRCFERLPVESITEIMGLENRSGARALLQKARRKLRAALADDAEGTPKGSP